MIGKLIEIHTDDAYYIGREYLLGTLWEISEMDEWDGGKNYTRRITGYRWGHATFAENAPLTFKSNDPRFEGTIVFIPNEATTFHAVKFEPIENLENN